MQLSKETIEKFKEIYERKEKIKLSDKDAFELASNLILMFDAIYRPIPLKEKSARLESANKNYGHTNDSN